MSQVGLDVPLSGAVAEKSRRSPGTTRSVHRGSWRTRVRQVHLWLGLIVGVHLLLMGVSGSALVFREEWNAALQPAVRNAPSVFDPEQVAAMISRRLASDFAGFKPRMLVFSDGERPLRITLQKPGSRPFQLYLDPSTAAVLGRSAEVSFPDQVSDFHHNLLMGRTGRVVNGMIAIVLQLLIATGLWLWVTQRRAIPLRLGVRWTNRRRGIFDLHTAAGFWLTPFLALMAFSGTYFAWHENIARFINTITFSKAPEPTPRADRKPGTAKLEEIAAAASRAMPDGKLSFIRLPERPGDPVVVRVKHGDEWRSNGSSHVYLNPSNASVLLSDRTSDQPIGTRIVRDLAPLHFGEFGGQFTRCLWVFLGLTPGTLFLTGFLMWKRKLA